MTSRFDIKEKKQQFTIHGKQFPNTKEIEEAVLGALMIQKDAMSEVAEILTKSEVFYTEANSLVYESINDLFSKFEPIDLLTVSAKLKDSGNLDKIGGIAYLVDLTNKVNSSANIVFHARILVEYAIRRNLISLATDIEQKSFDDTCDTFDTLNTVNVAIQNIGGYLSSKNESTLGQLSTKVLEGIDYAIKNQGLTGIPSGITELDRITGGFQKSELIIVAGRPGMGKTTAALQFCINSVLMFDFPVAFFSLEMGEIQLGKKIFASETKYSTSQITKGNVDLHDIMNKYISSKLLKSDKLIIDDTPSLSLLQLKSKALKYQNKYNIQMIVVDYLQLMTSGSNIKIREQEISAISRGLKLLAKTLNIPVIALSQLGRSTEQRGGDKVPQLSDLRESGAIEQDADMVIFTYRPEYYKIMQDENGNSVENRICLVVAKNRNGATESVWTDCDMKHSKIGDNLFSEPSYTFNDNGEVFELPTKTDVFKNINGSEFFGN